MKGFFDTSVLVPVFYGDHVHHRASMDLFIQFDKSTGCCGTHSLAEVYSTLTRMLAHCALDAKAEVIYTWNARRYALCGPEIGSRLLTPG